MDAWLYRILCVKGAAMLCVGLALATVAACGQLATVPARPNVPRTTAVLAGHVLDENGTPVRSAWVNATRWKDVAGKRRFTESRSVGTDSDGYFLIADLPPGSYTLAASPEDDPRAAGGVEAYQPSDGTDPIQLGAGSEVRDVRLVLRKQPAFAVSGTAVNAATGDPIENAQLVLTPTTPERTGSHSTRIRAGVFRFTNVLPGTYLIQTNPNDLTRDEETGGYRKVGLFARMQLVVGTGDVENLNLQLGPGGRLAGSFRMTTGNAVPPGAGLTLGPLEGIGSMLGAQAAGGSFQLSGVHPDRYSLHLTPPPGCYVVSIRADGEEVSGTLDLTRGGVAALEILLSPNGAGISGRVNHAGPGSAIVLWGPGDTGPQAKPPGEDGSYKFRNLGPGEYRILALEESYLIPAEDVDTWRALKTRATPIAVQEGARLRIAPLEPMK